MVSGRRIDGQETTDVRGGVQGEGSPGGPSGREDALGAGQRVRGPSQPQIRVWKQQALEALPGAFTGVLEAAGVAISRDGRGGLFDNIFVERLWRSVKYEEVYLKDYGHMAAARSRLGWYFGFYNHERPHQGLGYQIPAEVYGISRPPRAAPWVGATGHPAARPGAGIEDAAGTPVALPIRARWEQGRAPSVPAAEPAMSPPFCTDAAFASRPDQQDEQHDDNGDGGAGQEVLADACGKVDDAFLLEPVCHDQGVGDQEDGGHKPEHNEFSRSESHLFLLDGWVFCSCFHGQGYPEHEGYDG